MQQYYYSSSHCYCMEVRLNEGLGSCCGRKRLDVVYLFIRRSC